MTYQSIENIQRIILNTCLKNTPYLICGKDIPSKTSRIFYVKITHLNKKRIISNINILNKQIPYIQITLLKINKIKYPPTFIPGIKISIQENNIPEILTILKLYNYY